MTWQIIRSVQSYQIGAETDYQIIRAPSGPRGQAAGQDIGWVVSGALGAGEVLNFPPLPHAATFTTIYAHSTSGVAAPQTVTINQLRAGSIIASAAIGLTTGHTDWSTAIAGSGLAFAVADVAQLVLPSPADSQMNDLSVSLGSTP